MNVMIFRFCFNRLFTWNRTIKPMPALARTALKNAPSGKVPSANNWAETTEVAQFGINPNKVLKKGPIMSWVNKVSLSSFGWMNKKRVCKRALTAKMNTKIWVVWFKAEIQIFF